MKIQLRTDNQMMCVRLEGTARNAGTDVDTGGIEGGAGCDHRPYGQCHPGTNSGFEGKLSQYRNTGFGPDVEGDAFV